MDSKITEAFEVFSPQLGECEQRKFELLIERIDAVFFLYSGQLVKKELETIQNNTESEDQLKYLVSLSILYDLLQQGWDIAIRDRKLYLKMTAQNSMDKDYIRFRLSSERKAQFQDKSVLRFIEKMESVKRFNETEISIRNLIGNADVIIQRIDENIEPIVSPYIQLVSHEKDEYSGYWLSDIWRYFRYTWSIPYKTMPGRNLFYLVRDSSQPYHPVIGIFALGNSVLNLTVRDDEIGWTVEALQRNVKRRERVDHTSQVVSGTNGKTVGATCRHYIETEEEYSTRLATYCSETMQALLYSLKRAIDEIYVKDLGYHRGTKYPSREKVAELRKLSEELRELAIDNKKTTHVKNFEAEATEILFKKKRASELARLLEAKITFNETHDDDPVVWLQRLLKTEEGRKAVNVSLVANRKTKIGSNMMEVIVCGSIPPYNELLGGKLVSILACSPTVIKDYTARYSNQVSEIASRMKGKRVVRDSRLAFLGTTSLYAIGSSQYNRIKVPISDDFRLEYKKMGITEGYGTVYFSKQTTSSMMRLLELQDGGRRINNIFGEGTSPRFRLISRGLSSLGIRSEAFLRHYSPRIVYSMELAKNTNAFLQGLDDNLEYPFDLSNPDDVERITQKMIQFWYERWLKSRLHSVDITARLQNFEKDALLISRTR